MAESGSSRHPIDHIDSLKCYEWMLSECAAANAQRQAREDGLIGTVTQISSAATLTIPGFALASDAKIPNFMEAPAIYLGLAAFGAALILAMAEQHLSSIAYSKHIEIVQSYYTKLSDVTEDKQSRDRVRNARWLAYGCFGLALTLSSIGLLMWGAKHGA